MCLIVYFADVGKHSVKTKSVVVIPGDFAACFGGLAPLTSTVLGRHGFFTDNLRDLDPIFGPEWDVVYLPGTVFVKYQIVGPIKFVLDQKACGVRDTAAISAALARPGFVADRVQTVLKADTLVESWWIAYASFHFQHTSEL